MNEIKLVHKDNRGEIYIIKLRDGIQFNMLTTKKGCGRGGDLHPHRQFDLVLEGEFEVWLKKTKIEKKVFKKYDYIVIPPKIPHLFIAKKDTVMLEWWDKEFKATYYKPFRKIIENINEKE